MSALVPLATFMISKTFEDIVESVVRLLPRAPADLERNVRTALAAAFDRLDVVTREELEVQEAVLQRTRARLKELEERIAALERASEKK
jgi:BMFP domain-containing protein YqiC